MKEKDNNVSNDKKNLVDSESILMTLDQIGQTIDIMDNVVSRLRGYINEQLEENPIYDDEEIMLGNYAESGTLH